MIEISLFHYAMLVEISVLLAVFSALVLWRQRRRRAGPGGENAQNGVLDLARLRKMMKRDLEGLRSGDAGSTTAAGTAVEGGEEPAGAASRHALYGRFLETLTSRLASVKGPASETAPAFLQALRSSVLGCASVSGLDFGPPQGARLTTSYSLIEAERDMPDSVQDFFKMQRRRISELSIAEKAIQGFQERIRSVNRTNRELRRRLGERREDPELSECIAMLTKANEELEQGLAVVQEENRRLSEALRVHEDALGDDVARMFSEMDRDLSARRDQLERAILEEPPADSTEQAELVESLREEIEEKDREIRRLRESMQVLEKEYMELYAAQQA